MENVMYNNSENLSEVDILTKLAYGFSFCGRNRTKRKKVLESYSTDKISKSEWIKLYCK